METIDERETEKKRQKGTKGDASYSERATMTERLKRVV